MFKLHSSNYLCKYICFIYFVIKTMYKSNGNQYSENIFILKKTNFYIYQYSQNQY